MTSGLAFAALPERWRRPLSLGIAASLLLSAVGSGTAILAGYWDRAERIGALTDDIARLRAVLDRDGHARPPPGHRQDGEPPEILATDPEAALALVQSRLRTLAIDSGSTAVQVESTRVLQPQVGEAVTAVRVAAKLTVPASQVGRVINVLESSVPALLLDDVQISPSPGSGPNGRDPVADRAMTVVATLRIYASDRRAPGQTRQKATSQDPAPDTLP